MVDRLELVKQGDLLRPIMVLGRERHKKKLDAAELANVAERIMRSGVKRSVVFSLGSKL